MRSFQDWMIPECTSISGQRYFCTEMQVNAHCCYLELEAIALKLCVIPWKRMDLRIQVPSLLNWGLNIHVVNLGEHIAKKNGEFSETHHAWFVFFFWFSTLTHVLRIITQMDQGKNEIIHLSLADTQMWQLMYMMPKCHLLHGWLNIQYRM